MRDRTPLPRLMSLAAAWVACAALGLRGAQGVIVDLITLVSRELAIPLAPVFDPVFLVGGVLFGLLALSRTARP
ncbi:MAG TPA: hypothetical protein VIA06_05575, partial [Candidatus Dormibacteraeota bacterium]|nr:hypothetical protein [Candidatus Dormibacteraeota bacterium]